MNRGGLLAIFVRLAFLLTFTLSLSLRINSQLPPEPRTLSGTVYYAGGNQPAENISVELHTTEGSLIAPQVTSSNGWFEFRGIPRGVYVIAINASGFEPVNFNVDLTFNSSRGNVIYLRPRPGYLTKSTNSSNTSPISSHELSMPQKARTLMESGKKKVYIDKKVQAGLEDFQRAVAIAPGYYEAHYQIALAGLLLGQRDLAEKSFRKAIEVSGDKYGDAEIGLGTALLDNRNFPEGEKSIRRGIELSPDSWLGHYELGRALLNQDRIADAEKAALQARSLAPNAAIIYRLLSNIHLRQKNYPALLGDIDAFLKLDPASPAGIRAKQMRQEVQQKIDADKRPNPPPDSKP
jgi:tetratricopeptide (TPR) repeat protein